MRKALLFLVLASVVRAAAPQGGPAQQLARWLAGDFVATTRAAASKENRPLAMHAVLIWTERTDGPWLYVEQAAVELPDMPFRQQVCQIVGRPDGTIEYRIHALPDPIKLTGGWREPARFEGLEPADLKVRAHCTVMLRLQADGTMVGGTEGRGCASELGGAAYATIQMRVSGSETEIWERGFNAEGAQVWGPATGGYVFTRKGG